MLFPDWFIIRFAVPLIVEKQLHSCEDFEEVRVFCCTYNEQAYSTVTFFFFHPITDITTTTREAK